MKINNFFRLIEQIITRNNDSEYYENLNSSSIKLNDQNLNGINSIYFTLNPYFNIDVDLKLGTKSLLLKYLEIILEDMSFINKIEDIDNLITELNQNNDIDIIEDNYKLIFDFDNIEIKDIIKFMKPKILINDYEANYLDMEYEDILLYQLKIIEIISKKTDKNVIVTYTGYITEKLILKINELKQENLKILIYTNFKHKVLTLENYCFVNTKLIDLVDEININNEIIMSLPFHVNKEELNKLFIDYINGILNKKIIELKKLL